MTLNHVHLGTKNLAAFREFYQRYFGFEKKFDHGEGAFLANARELRAEPGVYASFFVKDPDGYRLEISWHDE